MEQKGDAKQGSFAFHTEQEGIYQFCFTDFNRPGTSSLLSSLLTYSLPFPSPLYISLLFLPRPTLSIFLNFLSIPSPSLPLPSPSLPSPSLPSPSLPSPSLPSPSLPSPSLPSPSLPSPSLPSETKAITGSPVLQIPSRTVMLTMKTGVEARDYAEVAKKENLKPLEIELRKIEDAAERIKNDMLYMKQRGMQSECTGCRGRGICLALLSLSLLRSIPIHLIDFNPLI